VNRSQFLKLAAIGPLAALIGRKIVAEAAAKAETVADSEDLVTYYEIWTRLDDGTYRITREIPRSGEIPMIFRSS